MSGKLQSLLEKLAGIDSPKDQNVGTQEMSNEQPVSNDLFNRLQSYENSVKKGYDPSTDTWMPHESIEGGAPTLAYGDKLLKNKYSPERLNEIMTKGISSEEANSMLQQNINKASSDADSIMNAKGIRQLDPVQKEALTEMVFQMGKTGTLGFNKMLSALQNNDYETAYKEALDSKWAKQTPQRANEVANRLRFGSTKRYLAKN